MSIRRKVVVISTLVVTLVWGIVLGESPAGATTLVHVRENALDPETLTIERGEEVVWKAATAVGPPHFDWMPTPKSARVRVTKDGDVAVTFEVPGEYRYIIPIGRGGKGNDELPGKIIVK